MSAAGKALQRMLIFVPIVLCALFFSFVFDVFEGATIGTNGTGNVYEDSFVVPADEPFDTVDYQVAFYTTDFDKKRVGLNMKFLEKEITDAYNLLQDLDQMSAWQLGITADYYEDPQAYFLQYSERYYHRLYAHDSEVLDRISALVEDIAAQEALSAMDTVNLVVSLVQNIRYEIPKINEFEVLSPVLCLDYRYGDCDTKTLLMLTILRKLGVDCIHLESDEYNHAMIGINVPATGDYLEVSGTKYYFLETTSPGWEIGVLPPDVNNTAYWYALNY